MKSSVTLRWGPTGQGLTIVATVLVGSVDAYLLVTKGPLVAFSLILAACVVIYAIRGATNALILSTAAFLLVPYWYAFGSVAGLKVTAVRLAALFVVLGIFYWRRTRTNGLDIAIGAFAVGAFASWLFTGATLGSGKLLAIQALALLLYIAARHVASAKIEALLLTVFGVGTLAALTVLAEYLHGALIFQDPTNYIWQATDTDVFRPGGVFGSPPGAATVLAMTGLCGLPLLQGASRRRRMAYAACLAITLIAITITFTRAGIIAVFVGAVVYLWLAKVPIVTPVRVVAASILVTLLMLLALPTLERTTTFQHGLIRSGTLTARESYWQLALPIITKNPHNFLFGLGLNSTLVPQQGAPAPASLSASPVLIANGTHNQYVLAWLEQGLIGFGLLVGWLVMALRTGLRAARSNLPHSRFASGLTAAVVAFAIILLQDNALLDEPSFYTIALVMGLLGSLYADFPSASRTHTREPAIKTDSRPAYELAQT